MSESWIPRQQDFTDFFELAEPLRKLRATEGEEDTDAGLEETLAMLSLLYDIPFAYLVPTEKLLAPHQIRFFYLDPNWIRVLLDGAMSLGRNVSVDKAHDSAFIEEVYRRAIEGNSRIRPRLQGKPEAQNPPSTPECTGFLLRSPLVRGWRGLEFKAYGAGEVLSALRLEALSEDVLLGLYQGVIDKLEILEPPESFHFGFNRSGANLSKRLRNLGDGVLTEREVPVAERGNRVVDFARTAETMGQALGVEITGAHMALEMIQNPHVAVITKK
ncbi:hypothetical protein [Dehalobacterium formicoaceticum]|uniref:hypothetical protein n=1 Tax=Dehalobacterium formicoaceticum TaxID=51515 RepID=UPI0031F6D666